MWVWGGGVQTAGALCPGKEGRAQPPPPPGPARGPLCQWAAWCARASSQPWARPVPTGGGRTAGGGPVPESGLGVTGMTSGCEPGPPGKPGQVPWIAAPASSLEGARETFRLALCQESALYVTLCPAPLSPSASPAAAAAKSLQSCPTLCDPIDGSPRGSPIPGILQARTLEWVAISFSNA